jgi:hypothetical protein
VDLETTTTNWLLNLVNWSTRENIYETKNNKNEDKKFYFNISNCYFYEFIADNIRSECPKQWKHQEYCVTNTPAN